MDQFTFIFQEYPVVQNIVAIMIMCRIVFKTAFTIAEKYVELTVSKEDDKKLHQIMDTKYYKAIVFLVDLLASVKLPTLKK